MKRQHRQSGFTLVELLVVTTLLAILYGVASGAIASALQAPTGRDEWMARLEEGRARAVLEGRAVAVWPDSAHLQSPVLFLPDGRAVGLEPESSQ